MSSHPGFDLEKVIDSVCRESTVLKGFLYEKRTFEENTKKFEKTLDLCWDVWYIIQAR